MASSLLPLTPLVFRSNRWVPAPAPAPAATATTGAPAGGTLNLLTWNAWFGRHQLKERAAALIDELSWRAPEVVALQEVTIELLRILTAHPLIRSTYQLSDVTASTFERYGVMLLSKVPFASLTTRALPSQMGRSLVVGTLVNGLSVATAHLESTASCAAERVVQLGIVQPLLKQLSSDVVFMGDMNFAPDSPSESAALDASFVDAWQHARFADPGFTVDSVRNHMRRRFEGLPAQRRIDRVFVRSSRWRVQDISLTGTAPIDAAGTFVSDHFGLEVVLERASS